MPVTGLARTICDLAAEPGIEIERLIDDFERRGKSLRWLEQTATQLATRGRSGPAAVLVDIERRRRRRAIGESSPRDVPAPSWAELAVARALLVHDVLPERTARSS